MATVIVAGNADPVTSFSLDADLRPLTNSIRSTVTVDLRAVESLHPSVVSVLIRHDRQARRLGGSVQILRPVDEHAARTLDHVGLVGSR